MEVAKKSNYQRRTVVFQILKKSDNFNLSRARRMVSMGVGGIMYSVLVRSLMERGGGSMGDPKAKCTFSII